MLEYPDGGTVAMAGPNPCGTVVLHELITEMLKKIYDEDERIYGRIIYDAKCRIIARYPTNDYFYGPAVLYTILADPALKIKYPLPPGVEEAKGVVAHSGLRLLQNPTKGEVLQIQINLDRTDKAVLSLYNSLGQIVKHRFLDQTARGDYTVNISTEGLTGGVYFLILQTDNFTVTKKVVLLK